MQTQVFVGLPQDLKVVIDAIIGGGGTIHHVLTTHVAATYFIIYTP